MLRRSLQISVVLLLLCLFVLPVAPIEAQATRRWLADPAMLTTTNVPAPVGMQVVDTIRDMKLVSPTDGWAVSQSSLLRFDGRWWKRYYTLPTNLSLVALDFVTPDLIWLVGAQFTPEAIGGYTTVIARFNPTTKTLTQVPLVRSDGNSGRLAGELHDIVVYPGGGMAIGTVAPEPRSWSKPLILTYDGLDWRDTTPTEWRFGQLSRLAMTGPQEAWVTGIVGRPGGSGGDAIRPAVLHRQAEFWVEEQLPELPRSGQPFSMGQIVMKDGGDGWAVFQDAGTRCSNAVLIRYLGGTWTRVDHPYAAWITLGLIPGTSQGWASFGACKATQAANDQRYRIDGSALIADSGGALLAPSVYALVSTELQWAAAGGSPMRYSSERTPAERLAKAPAGARFFTETGHAISGDFRRYYESHGLELGDRRISARESLALFGFPITEPFDEINPETGEVLRVQYFERARMELHPRNAPAYRVLLGRLGITSYLARYGALPIPSGDSSPPECQRFNETGFYLCPPLKTFWNKSGGLPVFGFPIAVANDERSTTDGQFYMTQWFERERLEYHPELKGTAYEVLLGLLGSEDLRMRGMTP